MCRVCCEFNHDECGRTMLGSTTMDQPVHERGRVLFESSLDSTEPGLVLSPNGTRSVPEPDRQAHRQQQDRSDDNQAHVDLHESFDNWRTEKVLVDPVYRRVKTAELPLSNVPTRWSGSVSVPVNVWVSP